MPINIVVLAATRANGSEMIELSQKAAVVVEPPAGAELLDTAAFSFGNASYIAALWNGQNAMSVLSVSSRGDNVALVPAANLQLSGKADLLESFVLGNIPYLAAYRRDKGIFDFYPVQPDLTCPFSYRFFRNHAPGVTAGFTTVKLFTVQGGVAYMGYNKQTGDVAVYTLSVIATSPPGIAPLLSLCVWDHQWAPGWTRFAFFQWGGGNFFLKTNTDKPNVNVDHLSDNPANGTVEVGSKLKLTDDQVLSIVEPFTLGSEDPYFITYRPDGHITLNRFRGDGQSWTVAGEFDAPAGAVKILPIRTSTQQLFVLCIPE